MKLTNAKAQWVKDRIRKYCREMQCYPPSMLILTAKGWNEWAAFQKATHEYKHYRSHTRALGICSHKCGVVAIFVKRFKTLERMDQTIRHELTHWVTRYNHRTDRFKKIMQLIDNGKYTAKSKSTGDHHGTNSRTVYTRVEANPTGTEVHQEG